jgi:hypothetical protein
MARSREKELEEEKCQPFTLKNKHPLKIGVITGIFSFCFQRDCVTFSRCRRQDRTLPRLGSPSAHVDRSRSRPQISYNFPAAGNNYSIVSIYAFARLTPSLTLGAMIGNWLRSILLNCDIISAVTSTGVAFDIIGTRGHEI